MIGRVVRRTALGVVLAASLFLVPNADVNPTDTALVRVPRAEGVDLSPDVTLDPGAGLRRPAGPERHP